MTVTGQARQAETCVYCDAEVTLVRTLYGDRWTSIEIVPGIHPALCLKRPDGWGPHSIRVG
jgi:hypothetical protein